MSRSFLSSSALSATFVTLVAGAASAHVSVASGPGFGGKSQEITFGVGHGCEGADTLSVRVEIPAEVTSVRTLTSDFGRATVETNDAGLVTAVTWQKPEADLLEADTGYYKLVMRIRVPDQPFTTLIFPAHQTCKAADGTVTVVDWIGAEAAEVEGGPEPAPRLLILPARLPGWNRYTVPVAVADLSTVFSDAQIVWKGDAAYSANPITVEQIAQTPGVTALAALAAGDEVWVKY